MAGLEHPPCRRGTLGPLRWPFSHLLGLAALAVVGLALRWATKAEQRANERYLINRLYYPKRGHRAADVPTLKRRH